MTHWTDRIYYIEQTDALIHFSWIYGYCYVSELTNELPEWTTTYRSQDFITLIRSYPYAILIYNVESWDER